MARKRSSDTRRRIALLAIAGGLAAALGAAGKRLAGGDVGQKLRRRGSAAETYRCSCGTAYRVSGVDRHRVYWLADAPESDPVLGTKCVQCGTELPAGHAVATA